MPQRNRLRRRSLTSRLLIMIGLASVLPLLTLTVAIWVSSYQLIRTSTYQGIEQTSRRIAGEFESTINEKLGRLEGAALAIGAMDEAKVLTGLKKQDKDLREIWVQRPEDGVNVRLYRQELFTRVRDRNQEFLSAPDFSANQASLGVPIQEDGRFVGMLGVSFSLEYFQRVVSEVHPYDGYAFMVSHQGVRIAHPVRALIGKKIGEDVSPEQGRLMLAGVAEGEDFWLEKPALLTGQWSRQFYSVIRVGESPERWFFAIVVPEEAAVRDVNRLFLIWATGILATLLLVAGATWRAARTVVRPLQELARGANAVADGHLDARVAWVSQDEVGTLAQAFNKMTDRLVWALRDQEAVVRDRTASLEASLEELARAQAQVVESEKLAVLGQLTATIAHEINTPLAAIRSSASFLRQNVIPHGEALLGFFGNHSAEDREFFVRLVKNRGISVPLSVGERDRKRRRRLVQELTEQGVPDPERIADDIVLLSGSEDEGPLVDAMDHGKGPVIQKAAETVLLIQSSAIIVEAADRAAATVSALVDYARVDTLQANQSIDPEVEIDTILALYYGLSKKGVDVVRHYESGVKIQGDRDRLNQVWVNLINNALQAMGYQGQLVLRVRSTPGGVEVQVGNDGPRIPQDLREKIFQPFFTTKRPGEGTGLGLDICRRIVEAHRGTITLSEEGALTIFTVRFFQGPPPEETV